MRQEPAVINSTSNEGKHVQHPFLERGESVPAGNGSSSVPIISKREEEEFTRKVLSIDIL